MFDRVKYSIKAQTKGVLRALSSIYDGAFLVNDCKLLTYFRYIIDTDKVRNMSMGTAL